MVSLPDDDGRLCVISGVHFICLVPRPNSCVLKRLLVEGEVAQSRRIKARVQTRDSSLRPGLVSFDGILSAEAKFM
ncbi:hypothetical protein D3C87_1708960 [compost metagenome]